MEQKLKEVTEMCPFCDTEATFEVGYEVRWGKCPECGRLLHFCDECMYNHDWHCNPMCPTSYCHEHYVKEPVGFKEYI
jgi:hypothetical protein